MPTFAPVRPYYAPNRRVIQGARLSAYYPANYYVPTPMNVLMRGQPSVGLSRYGLGQDVLNAPPPLFSDSGAPPPPPAPGLPQGYDASTGLIAAGSPAASGITPAVQIGPMAPSIPSGALLAPGTFLTYTVTYQMGYSGAFTGNDTAIASIAPMLAGVGLNVTNVQTPATLNPFSNNQAVVTIQVGAANLTLQSAKQLCDNAIVNGIGAQIISSALAPGQPSPLTWLQQNWMMLAGGALALLLLPKLLDL